jgi:hypothetical protein
VTGFIRLTPIILAILFGFSPIDMALAQPSKTIHPMAKSKAGAVDSVDTLLPKEADDKNSQKASGWNGSYVGVNAGTSFGATTGTNVVIPLGSDSDK